MAPKRKATAVKPVKENPEISASDEDVKPKKKNPSRAPKTEGSPSKSASRPKQPALTEPTATEDGWTLHPPSLIYKAVPAAQGSKKIAAFDLDGTLVHVKSRARFALDADDWKWFNKRVPTELRRLAEEEGYQLVIFSNQGGIRSALAGAGAVKTRGRVDNVLAALTGKDGPLHAQVFMSTLPDDLRKPGTGMWDFFTEHCNAGVKPDLSQSFYVGDMAGRVGDIQGTNNPTPSDTDKGFAEAIGIAFKTPEEVFGEGEAKKEVVFEGSSGKNDDLANAFQTLTDHFRRLGDGFKANAFAKVQKVLAGWPTKITSSKDLKGVAGVGKGSAAKIDEFLETGKFAVLEEEGGEAAQLPSKAAADAAPFLNI
ncbi:hypothetical protein ACKKBF_B32900 [Auxenochlorella protothecoides x Auxenochlorella symbiontica]